MSNEPRRRSRRTWPLGTDPLVLDVDELRARGLLDFVDPQSNVSLPQLSQIAEELFPATPRGGGPFASLRDLIRTAVGGLPLEHEKRAAEKLFGVHDRECLKLDHRQDLAASCYPNHVRPTALTFRQQPRYERSIVFQVASKIADMQLARYDQELIGPDGDDSAYVPRRSLEEDIRRALRDDCRIVVLQGVPGAGKSWVAQRMAQELTRKESPCIRVDVASDRTAARDIVDFMASRSEAVPGSDVQTFRAFRNILTTDQAPSVTIIENAECCSDLLDIIPTRPHGKVIITSRVAIEEFAGASTVHVGCMSLSESTEMVRRRLPGVNETDAECLAATLDGLPLALHGVCGLLETEPTLTVSDILESLSRSLAQTLDATDTNPTLTAIYYLLVDSLTELQSRVVRWIVFARSNMTVRLIFELESATSVEYPSTPGEPPSLIKLQVLKAIRWLEKRSLIDFKAVSIAALGGAAVIAIDNMWRTDGPIRMHGLASRILSEILLPQEDAFVALVKRIDSIVGEEWPYGLGLPLPWMNRGNILAHIFADRDAGFAARHLGTLALALRSAYQLGVAPGSLLGIALEAYERASQFGIGSPEEFVGCPGGPSGRLLEEVASYLRLDPLRQRYVLTDEQLPIADRVRTNDPVWWRINELMNADEWYRSGVDDSDALVLPHLAALTSEALKVNRLRAGRLALAGAYFNFHMAKWSAAREACEGALDIIEASVMDDFGLDEAGQCFTLLSLIDIREGTQLGSQIQRFDRHAEHMRRFNSFQSWNVHSGLQLGVVTIDLLRANAFRDYVNGIDISEAVRGFEESYAEFARRSEKGRFTVPVAVNIAAALGEYCCLALRDISGAAIRTEKLVEAAGQAGFMFARARCELAQYKMRAATLGLSGRREVLDTIVPQLSDLRRMFKEEFGVPYWAADAAGAAYALGHWAGLDKVALSALRADALDLANTVGRIDKVEIGDRADSLSFSPIWFLGA